MDGVVPSGAVQRIVVSLLVLLCACPATRAPTVATDVPACVADAARAVKTQGSFDPAGAVAELLETHDVVAVGEFHRLVEEIRFFADVVGHATGAFDVGMELLPATRQADLDDLVTSADFEEWRWWRILGDRHQLVPMDAAEYVAVPRAVWEANRTRDVPIRLVGLLPDCRLESRPSVEATLDCFRDRDATMAEIAEREVLGRGRKLLVSAGTFHVGRTGEGTFTEQLAARSVATVLLAGPVEGDGEGWDAACGGLFRSLHAALGRAFWVPTAPLDLDGCSARGFDSVVELGPATIGPTAPDGVAFSALGAAPLASWDRFRTELLNEPARGDAETWRLETARELMRFTDRAEPTPKACPD